VKAKHAGTASRILHYTGNSGTAPWADECNSIFL